MTRTTPEPASPSSDFRPTPVGERLAPYISVAQKLKLRPEPAVNKLYGFGNQRVPVVKSIGRIRANIEVDKIPSNDRPYSTTAHVSQLKAWKYWNEDDDNSSTNSDDEPEMQRHKRTVRKPERYGAFMSDR
ncbi:hypothetical protein AVEN_112838-1 [Araneus ventricosus]|uniref:Uncharacterized protein n=1 Tax=Araneus ventricosus TaxID=182803 RepID=A0A4Y2HEE8_ARAVE|nr:hypothetical protein AVEN_112838-1 [Araneus ventricosus]